MNKEKLQLELEEKEILKFLISLGTPNLYRSKLWLLCSGAKREINDNPEYYAKLILLSNNVPSLYEKQINLDVLRSNPQKNKDQEYLNKLYVIQLEIHQLVIVKDLILLFVDYLMY